MDGRVLTEALRESTTDAPAWTTTELREGFSARGRDSVQRVWFEQVGTSAYLAGGTVEPA